ncbi:hypothetical protein M8R20_21635 [Pseudomonas sp. R2.Fl]|nr:hypothetical protein [Pseudomonas sp. R2.Fl]
MRFSIMLPLAAMLAVAGCSSVAEKAESAANRSFTSYALGKPYTQVASVGQSPLELLAGNDRATFGPMLGATQLENGMTVYRHMAPAAQMETSSSFGGLVGRESVSTNNRLSYFLVGPDGIVKDWATGSVQGATTDCVTYIGGIINRCSDTAQLQAALAFYDSRVLTKGGQPITAWGTPAAAASALPGAPAAPAAPAL